MKLDTENDRSLLLELISSAQISGTHVFVVADLIKRVQSAGVDEKKKVK